MRRSEFLNEVQDWDKLLEFCESHGCEVCDDIFTERQMNDYLNENLVEMAENADGWKDLLNTLLEIPLGNEYYTFDEGDFFYADRYDFDYHKNEVVEWCEYNDEWDDEEQENVEEGSAEEDNEELNEDFPAEELFVSCASILDAVMEEQKKEREQERQMFTQLINIA